MDKTHFVLSHAQPNPLDDSRALAISLLTKLRVLSPPCGTPGKRDKTLATNFHCHLATRSLAHALTCSFPLSPRRAGGSSHEIFGAFGAFAVQSPPRGSADNICGQLASLSGQRHRRILCRHSSPRAPCVQPLSRFKYENSMFSGLFAFQTRHSLFALDEKSFARPPDTRRPDHQAMEQSWYNGRAKSLRFPASALKHCSIDLSFSSARGARHRESCKPPVTVVLQSRSPNTYFSRLFAPALQHTRETLSSQKIFLCRKPVRYRADCCSAPFGTKSN